MAWANILYLAKGFAQIMSLFFFVINNPMEKTDTKSCSIAQYYYMFYLF